MSHAERLDRVRDEAEAREAAVTVSLAHAFEGVLVTEPTDWVRFDLMDAAELAAIPRTSPGIAKGLLEACNLASRALERDLGIQVNLYRPTFSAQESVKLAGLLLGRLPARLPLATLTALDRRAFVDKQLRAEAGNWERRVLDALNHLAAEHRFAKHKLKGADGTFELDCAAFHARSGSLAGAVDVKRINGVARDVLNRARDIRDTARKLRACHAELPLVAVIYYPDPAEHDVIRQQISQGSDVRDVLFASEEPSSLEAVALAALAALGLPGRRAGTYAHPLPVGRPAALF